MKNKWLIALYKINEVKRVEANLSSQKFKYYLPKITTTKTNSNPKVEVLFPGYIFINTSPENYSVLKYTKGIKDILKFGDQISSLSSDEIKAMQMVEKTSKSTPLVRQLKIGQDAFVKKGSLKGNIDADVVTISGKCDGQVSGDVISVKSTGKITGEVFYENISIEEGAVVEAQIGRRKNKN